MKSDPFDAALSRTIADFQLAPQQYFTEEDLRWRLMKQLELSLEERGCQEDRGDGTGHFPQERSCLGAER